MEASHWSISYDLPEGVLNEFAWRSCKWPIAGEFRAQNVCCLDGGLLVPYSSIRGTLLNVELAAHHVGLKLLLRLKRSLKRDALAV